MKLGRMSFVIAAATSFVAALPALAAVSYAGGTYVQDFDTLPTTGTTNAWSNDVTLTGWFSIQSMTGSTAVTPGRDTGTWNATGPTVIRAGDGASNTGALYSFGTGTATDRALGSVGSGTPGDFVWALVLQNTSGGTLSGFTLRYDGEQWRDGGAAIPVAQSAIFDFSILPAAPARSDIQGSNVGAYTAVPALNFSSPTFTNTGSGVALDGNAVANRTAGITSTISSITWNSGDYLILRWWDDNHAGNDHGLSIDNVNFSTVPEPTTLVLLALGGLLAVKRRRTR